MKPTPGPSLPPLGGQVKKEGIGFGFKLVILPINRYKLDNR